MLEALAVELMIVHMVDGREVPINPTQVTHMSEARRDVDIDKQLAKGVNCVVFLVDGSYVSSSETCNSIVNRWFTIRPQEGVR